MSSLTNINIQAKSMNGLNVINADEITTENFNVSTVNANNLTVSGLINTNDFKATGSLILPSNSIQDYNLSSNVPLKNASNTFTSTNIFNNIQPVWDINGTNYLNSYRIGNNIGTYQNILSNNNLCWGDFSLYGAYNNNPTLTRASNNICLGHYTGYKFSDIFGSDTSSCNRNFIGGNNALRNGFINCLDNVVIGNNCCKQIQAIDNSVIIGSGTLQNNGNSQSNSTIIGCNSFSNSGNGGSNTIIGYNNINGLFSGNAITCLGANNMNNAVDNNRGLIIGTDSGTSHYNGYSCFYIGAVCGNHNYDGYSNIYIGNYINGNSSSYYNNIYIGHHDTNIGEAGLQDNNEFVIGGCFSGTGYARLTLPKKNYLYCCQYPSTSTFNLNFRTEDTVILSSTTTIINLPTVSIYNYNSGAKFQFIKNYSSSVSITINAPSGQYILDTHGIAQSSIVLSSAIYHFKLYVINSSTTSTTTWSLEFQSVPSNVALKDAINEFSTGIAGDKIIKVMTYGSTTTYTYMDNFGNIGFYNGGGDNWVIDSYGNANFTNIKVSPLLQLKASSTFTNTFEFYCNGVNNASINGTGFKGDGSQLTSLNASSISSGTISDARLSSNVVLINTTPIFNPKISLVNANTNILIGENNSNNGSACVCIGKNAGQSLTGSNGYITAIGGLTLQSLLGTSSQNIAIGYSTINNLQSGSYNVGIGAFNGQALTNGCDDNYLLGHGIFQQSLFGTGYASTYTFNTTAQALVTTLTLPSTPLLLKAGQTVDVYNGSSGRSYNCKILSYNPTTNVITLDSTLTAIGANSYIYYWDSGTLNAQYTAPSTLTGTTITIGTGLNIQAGNICAYRQSTTLGTSKVVLSYNSGTGALSFSTSITVLTGTIMYFNNATGNSGVNINNNSIAGTNNCSNIANNISNNCVFGSNSLNQYGNSNFTSYAGSNNTVFGANSGNYICWKSSNNTCIGYDADISSTVDYNNINHSTCLGADSRITASNHVVLGSTTDTVQIPNQIWIRYSYAPYAVSTINTAGTLGVPFSGTYIVNLSATPITISLPTVITADMIGVTLWFKRITNSNVLNINYAAATTNKIYTRNSSASTTGTTTNTLLSATQFAGSITCLSTTAWAIIV